MAVSSAQSPFYGFLDFAGGGLPGSKTNRGDRGAGVEGEPVGVEESHG